MLATVNINFMPLLLLPATRWKLLNIFFKLLKIPFKPLKKFYDLYANETNYIFIKLWWKRGKSIILTMKRKIRRPLSVKSSMAQTNSSKRRRKKSTEVYGLRHRVSYWFSHACKHLYSHTHNREEKEDWYCHLHVKNN